MGRVMARTKDTDQKEPRLTRTLPAVRVTDEVYEFFERKRDAERRRKISEVVRLALEDYAAERVAERVA
jgi:hypothetical protein